MTQAAVVANPGPSRIRVAGVVCLTAGLVGAVASICLALLSPVEADGFTFPHGAPELTGLQMLVALLRVGLIIGLLGLRWSGAARKTRGARFGQYAAVATMAALTVTEGLAVSVRRYPLDGTPPVFGVIYGAYSALLTAALLVEGLGVARGGVWQGWQRWLPLSLGVWLLVVALPAMALSFEAARWAMSAWLLLFAMLGFTLVQNAGTAPEGPTAGSSSGMRSARSAAVVTWVYVAAFGGPSIPIAAYVLQNGSLPWFLDSFEMYGGPWSDPFEQGSMVLLLMGFLVVTLAAAWAAWLVWNGSRLGGVLGLALLPVEAAFWYGFALPLPWLLGLARAVLLIAAWGSLSLFRTPDELDPAGWPQRRSARLR